MNKRTVIRQRLLAIEPLEERCVLSACSATIGYSHPTSDREPPAAVARRVRHILERSRELLDLIGLLAVDRGGSSASTSAQRQKQQPLRLDPQAVDLAFASFAQE
jgi:hypothetical protein